MWNRMIRNAAPLLLRFVSRIWGKRCEPTTRPMNKRAAEQLAALLPNSLVHPGDPEVDQPAKAVPMPWLSDMGLSDEQQQHFREQAGLPANDTALVYATAIINALETKCGLELVDRTQLDAVKASAATAHEADPLAPTVTLKCMGCKAELAKIGATRAIAWAHAKDLTRPCTCPT